MPSLEAHYSKSPIIRYSTIRSDWLRRELRSTVGPHPAVSRCPASVLRGVWLTRSSLESGILGRGCGSQSVGRDPAGRRWAPAQFTAVVSVSSRPPLLCNRAAAHADSWVNDARVRLSDCRTALRRGAVALLTYRGTHV
jgi:hypothetical protein